MALKFASDYKFGDKLLTFDLMQMSISKVSQERNLAVLNYMLYNILSRNRCSPLSSSLKLIGFICWKIF